MSEPNSHDDLRLIEDYLPIEAISKEAAREKSVRKGHISTLHLWWARRPLVACRAAVYGALVPADRWVKDLEVKNPPADSAKAVAAKNGKKKGLNRKAAKEFVTKLCRYPKTDPTGQADIKIKRDTEAAIVEAQRHILEAHADRLTAELAEAKKTGTPPAWVKEFTFDGNKVTYDDIVAGRAPRPRVLDMFAGGGAIPLEALRLGCEAYALDLNPVAHIIELCTLVYPQKYGKPDPTARGMTGPKNAKGEATWGGLAAEVRYWGNWVLERERKEIGDLYPLIPDPKHRKPSKKEAKEAAKKGAAGKQLPLGGDQEEDDGTADVPEGYLMPVAYLWTRTVRCKNPKCAAIVPLVKQTWLCKKENYYVALKMIAPADTKRTRFEVIEGHSEADLGFDPAAFSKGGNATCPFCGTVADVEYVKTEGWHGRMSRQMMAVVAVQPGHQGKRYLAVDEHPVSNPEEDALRRQLARLSEQSGLDVPDEPIANLPADCGDNSLGITVRPYGIRMIGDLFTTRQLICLLSFCEAVRISGHEMELVGIKDAHIRATLALLACVVDKQADLNSCLSRLKSDGGRGIVNSFGRQVITMVWDFAEANPFNSTIACWLGNLAEVVGNIQTLTIQGEAIVQRGSALNLPWASESLDAVITDPPYYDNVPYADISDFFYVWLKRSIGNLFREHFTSQLTPKKGEAIADAGRHGGDMAQAKCAYEEMISEALREARRVLKQHGQIAVVYAHKTTVGWATLVNAFRAGGFEVTEAWPLDTETSGRLRARDSASLASSIFLIARKRNSHTGVGNYEDDVQPELQQIVGERVETLWDMGIAGADLVIACVGAGLRAFTKYEKVEYANGEEVPAEKFLAEVEGVVLDTMLGKLSGVVGGNVSAVDNASRFYVLWRFVYKAAELDAGEAIIFANGTHIELDGPHGLSAGKDALVEKKKAKYRARDFTERGSDAKLGLPAENGQPAPLIDALHRILWLMDNSPRKLAEFLDEARPDRERLRVLAQALAGAALSGKSEEEAAKLVSTTAAEQAALGKLLANWRSLIESRMAAEEGGLFGKR
ncbi:MAG: DUF1156 domain-containing protein [Planctomycetes bacterium]|nr:DUF1156 domain-containing protein [Planctomycetota bacterium]